MQIFKSCYLVKKPDFIMIFCPFLRLMLQYEIMLKYFWYKNSTWWSSRTCKVVTCKKWGNVFMDTISWIFFFEKQMLKIIIFMFQTVLRFLRISYFGYVLWLLTLNTFFKVTFYCMNNWVFIKLFICFQILDEWHTYITSTVQFVLWWLNCCYFT